MIQWIIFELKATEGIRTPDLLITNQLLYRLSHGSNTRTKNIIYMEQKFCKCFYTFSERWTSICGKGMEIPASSNVSLMFSVRYAFRS